MNTYIKNIETEIAFKNELLKKYSNDKEYRLFIQEEIDNLKQSLNSENRLLINDLIPLLAQSLSLDKSEKHRVIINLPSLTRFQLQGLMNIFEEERKKFLELAEKHPDDIKKLNEMRKGGESMGVYSL